MFLVPTCPIHKYNNIIAYIPNAVHYIPWLFYNYHLYFFLPSPFHPAPPTVLYSGNHQSVPCIYESVHYRVL